MFLMFLLLLLLFLLFVLFVLIFSLKSNPEHLFCHSVKNYAPPPTPTKVGGGPIVLGTDPICVGVGVKLLVLSVT